MWGGALEGYKKGEFSSYSRMKMGMGMGKRVKFLEHVLCGDERLRDIHSSIMQWQIILRWMGIQ